jgi:phosphinothricin acetyltransferase
MTGPSPASAVLSRLRLRPATPADMAAVAAIYAHHVLNGRASFELTAPDVAEMTRRFEAIAALGLPYLVAEADGAVLGYAYAARYRERAAYRFTVEDSIYVAPEAGRRGVGRTLLAELIERCTALGYRQMVAVIGDTANVPSIGLHVRLGFRLVGVFPAIGFKFGQWVDSVLMCRALGDGDRSPPD